MVNQQESINDIFDAKQSIMRSCEFGINELSNYIGDDNERIYDLAIVMNQFKIIKKLVDKL